jgi:hypothetical protein
MPDATQPHENWRPARADDFAAQHDLLTAEMKEASREWSEAQDPIDKAFHMERCKGVMTALHLIHKASLKSPLPQPERIRSLAALKAIGIDERGARRDSPAGWKDEIYVTVGSVPLRNVTVKTYFSEDVEAPESTVAYWTVSGRCDRLSTRVPLATPKMIIEGEPVDALYIGHTTIGAADGYSIGASGRLIGDVYHFESKNAAPFPFAKFRWRSICLAKLNRTNAEALDPRIDATLARIRERGFTVVRFANMAGVQYIAKRGDEVDRGFGQDDGEALWELAAELDIQ